MNEKSLEQENNFLKEMIRTYYQLEIERLHSIIKEVREYNEHLIRDAKYHLNEGHLRKIKKILDKENK